MEEQEIELRSEDVQEILGTPPGWIVRWGTTVAFVVVGVFALAGWLLRYPDVIQARVVLTTAVPPVEVIARSEGHISQLLVRDTQAVRRGDVLMVMQSTANFEHVMRLDSQVNHWQNAGIEVLQTARPARNLELGELQADYSIFVQNLENLQFGKTEKNASVRTNVGSISNQIAALKRSIQLDEQNKTRAQQQLQNAREFFATQQKLYSERAISLVELRREQQKLADVEQQVATLDEGIIRKRNDILSLEKNIGELTFSEKEDASTVSVRVRESLNALRSSLDKWKQTYLLTAPIAGRASLNAAFFGEQQFVKLGDQVLTIVPTATDSIIGRVFLPVAGSGKVRQGQRVILRLDSYPYYEFGTVEGRVESKSLVPKDNQYAIFVSLPIGLTTSYQKPLQFEQQLQGEAQIVTENKRFLERIWDQIFARATAYN